MGLSHYALRRPFSVCEDIMSEFLIDALAEAAEAEFMYQYESLAPQSAKATLGIAAQRIGGGVALSMRNDVTGYWSKALGFGFAQPVTADLIDQVVKFYRAQHSPGAVFQIAPTVLPADWDAICLHHDIQPDSPWVKLACPIGDVGTAKTTLRVGPVAAENANEWASVTMRGFGMPEDGLVDMMAASAGNPQFHPFAAWDGDEMVATANLFVRDSIGSLNAAATLPSHRNQGAQSALLAARAKAAADEGCHWLVAEAGKPSEGEVNPSLNNLLRFGMRPLYDRQNWSWKPADN
jgi:GNAT superfamily N-acetyltransferase